MDPHRHGGLPSGRARGEDALTDQCLRRTAFQLSTLGSARVGLQECAVLRGTNPDSIRGRVERDVISPCQSIYYRTSSFESTPVTSAETVRIDSGYLGITTKHVYFTGGRKGFRVPYKKIMAITPFKDGFGIVRDAASAKPQVFQTEDGWFAYNLVRNLASRSPD